MNLSQPILEAIERYLQRFSSKINEQGLLIEDFREALKQKALELIWNYSENQIIQWLDAAV